MAIFQSDLTIKTAIQLGLEDIRKNPWLIDDILGDAVNSPYLKDKYGQKQVDACKEWFKNNQIDVYMADRKDKDRFPCITITLGTSQEKDEMKHMADQSTEKVKLMPNQIGKPIPYVVKPFTATTYNDVTGELTIPDTVDLSAVAENMILVDPSTAQGYLIVGLSPSGLLLEPGLVFTSLNFAIVPKNQFYEARVEHTFFQETYNIGCHVSGGDQQALLWLWSIVIYSILRYRESLLEAQGFTQSSINSSDMLPNHAFSDPAGSLVWSRYVTLTGMVENSWIKSPRRFIEKVSLKEKTNTGYLGGIKIISNLNSPEFVDKEDENWYTVEDESE